MNATISTGVLVGGAFSTNPAIITSVLVGTSFGLAGLHGAVTTGLQVATRFVPNSGSIASGRYRR